ncbi:hypothetical protein TWF730_003153 [Orbilia blumenaviensis]|uniref:Uncharacterized protein n=1 Tax=Orbilia blumenaviensis TaxID=1796055 RepID=A0AAV9U5C2_9PEZI
MATSGASRTGGASKNSIEDPVETDVDIVLLPGLVSNDERRNQSYRSTGKFGYLALDGWAGDVLPVIAPGARVMEFEYDDTYGSEPVLPGGTIISMIQGHAKVFLKDMKEFRGDALVLANSEPATRKSILECIHGIIFLGTPHRGADIGKVVANILTQAFPGFDKNSIAYESVELLAIMEAFCGILGKIEIATFYEDKKTKFATGGKHCKELIVPPSATIIGIKNELPTGIACQHHLLTSPNDLGDLRFYPIWRRIVEFTGKTASDHKKASQQPLLQWYLPSPAKGFYGREIKLHELKDALLDSDGRVITGKSLEIHGLKGIGKSELVLQYINEPTNCLMYSAVLWVRCSNEDLAFESLRLIYNELSFRCPHIKHEPRSLGNPSGEITRRTVRAVIKGITKRLTSLSHRPWLVVLDDLQFQLQALKSLAEPNGQTIITTTKRLNTTSKGSLHLQGVDDDAAAAIIMQDRQFRQVIRKYTGYITSEEIPALNEKVGGNCFALNLLGASTFSSGDVTRRRGEVPRLPDLFNQTLFKCDDFLAYANSRGEARHILHVVKLAFGTMKLREPDTVRALKLLGHLSPLGITSTLMKNFMSTRYPESWIHLYNRKSEEMAQTSIDSVNLKTELENIWNLFRAFGLLNNIRDTETNQFRLLPHPIIHTWLQRNLDDIGTTKCLLFIGGCLTQDEIHSHDWPKTWPQLYNGELASQLRCWFRHMEQFGLFTPGPENPFAKYPFVIGIPQGLGVAFKLVQDQKRSLKLFELALDLLNSTPGSATAYDIYELARKLSMAYWKTGNLERGLDMAQLAVNPKINENDLELLDQYVEEAVYQKDQMQYKIFKLNGGLDEEEEEDEDDTYYLTDSEYETCDNETLDILDILSGNIHSGKLADILLEPLDCHPHDYDRDILFQLLSFNIDLNTPTPSSLEAEFILKVFQSFIQNYINLAWSDYYQNTILHAAAKEGHSLIVELLLKYESRFNINAIDYTGTTPLAYAVLEGSKISAELLIGAGAKLDFRPWRTSSPLLFRVLSTDTEPDFLRYLLEAGLKDTINEPHLHYGTILHHAAISRPASIVKLLLEYGADTNAVDYMSLTPLALAITLGYADGVLELLLEHTDTNILDYRGRHITNLRCRGADIEAIRRSHSSPQSSSLEIPNSQLRKEADRAEILVYYWLRSQSYRPSGYMLEVPNQMYHVLMHAGFRKFAVLVRGHEKSLAAGSQGEIRPDMCSNCGVEIDYDSPAFVCRRCCPTLFCRDCAHSPEHRHPLCLPGHDVKLTDLDCRPILNGKGFQFRRGALNSIFKGAEKRFKCSFPAKHSLWGLVETGQIDLVQEHVERLSERAKKMIDIDAMDFTGYTILHFAAEEERDDIFIYLASQGAYLGASDIAGWSVAHSAATAARMDILRYMAKNGANLDAQDAYGRTPLHVAALEGNVETVKLLLQLGVDITIVDENCQRACDIPSIDPEIKTILENFKYGIKAELASRYKQDPTSEFRREVRAKKEDLRGYKISSYNVLAYS